MTNITKRSLVAAGVLAALMAGNVALAADVPAGVTLAENKHWYVTMVQKFSHQIRTKLKVFRSLISAETCLKAYWSAILTVIQHLASLNPGIIKTRKSGPSICVKMRNGLMARQSQHKTLCIAGNVLLIRTLLLRMPVICNMGISPVLMKFLKGKTDYRSRRESY